MGVNNETAMHLYLALNTFSNSEKKTGNECSYTRIYKLQDLPFMIL